MPHTDWHFDSTTTREDPAEREVKQAKRTIDRVTGEAKQAVKGASRQEDVDPGDEMGTKKDLLLRIVQKQDGTPRTEPPDLSFWPGRVLPMGASESAYAQYVQQWGTDALGSFDNPPDYIRTEEEGEGFFQDPLGLVSGAENISRNVLIASALLIIGFVIVSKQTDLI